MPTSLFKRSLAFLSLAAIAAAIVFACVGLSVLGAAYSASNASSLTRSAQALSAVMPGSALGDAKAAAAFAKAAASTSGYRVTLILTDGRVLADSEADSARMENHGSRPEVAGALAGAPSSARRVSATVGADLLYAAAPIRDADNGNITGVLRLALLEPSLQRAIAPSQWSLALAALAFAFAAIGAAAAFSRMTSRPLAAITRAAQAYAALGPGSTDAALRATRPEDPVEIRLLASSLDSMAAEIGERVLAAKVQGKKLEAILDAMSEAVLALDAAYRITIANPAAAALFNLGAGEPATGPLLREGKSLLEATRSSDLQALAADCLASGEERRAEIALYQPAERVFQAFAAPLAGRGAGPGTEGIEGVVIVLNDISELRRLERVRKDFVANVSHELRTPVQLVKGFAESLSEGALEDPEQARRFVGIIGRNASRMESLIDDLLSLASLEREGRDWLAAERAAIGPILRAAREAIGPKAEGKSISIRLDCAEGLDARVDPGLLEQALVNLIDNAVKYSPPSTTVSVTARSDGDTLLIEVRDQGIGIPASDLPRIFERFYRVDKARSRELGGTGLGLAIVRHIAIAHGGEASVESWEGEGSTFRLRLPR